MDDHSNPFWQYSLKLYACKGVADLCLHLQDESGLDVNLLLYCLWQGSLGRRLRRETLSKACGVSAQWKQEVVESLRRARRWMKDRDHGIAERSGGLRERIKALELAAEKCQQDWLAASPAAYDDAAPVIAAAGNLSLYVEESGSALGSGARDGLLGLLTKAFPDASPESRSEAQQLLAASPRKRD